VHRMAAMRFRRGGLLLLASALRGFASVCAGLGSALCDETSGYVVILDAGSTHTAIFAFRYSRRKLVPSNFPLIIDSPLTIPELLATFRTYPGISSFKNTTNRLASSLHFLCMAGKDAILLHDPSVNVKRIPVYLAATAGLREMVFADRERIMHSVRVYLRSNDNPFSFRRDEQARMLAGEEEGAFAWLAVNQLKAKISPDPHTTLGAVDFGGGSVQITFVPAETSILAGIFPMHFGGAGAGPIHLYSHSHLRFGKVTTWQRATQHLLETVGRNSSQGGIVVPHPCLPSGLTWHVDPGQFGVTTTSIHPRRSNGPVVLKGIGDFHGCKAVAEHLIVVDTPCYQPPCSLNGVYQPELNNTPFVLFGEEEDFQHWEVLARVKDGHAVLSALRKQLPRVCSLPKTTQLELFGQQSLKGVPPCWKGTWILTFLTKGLHFKEHTADVRLIPGCCEHTLGQAIYEINYFPYRLEEVKPSKQLLITEQISTLPFGGRASAASSWVVGTASVVGVFAGAAIAFAFFRCKRFASTGMGFPKVLQESLLRS